MNRAALRIFRVSGLGSRVSNRGLSLVEFTLVLPFALMFILTVVGLALTGTRAIVGRHAAMRVARVHAVYQGQYADDELYAMLPSALFRGGQVDDVQSGADGITVETFARPLFEVHSLRPSSRIQKSSPKVYALPGDLSDTVLSGGDTPSPYCKDGGGYSVCGYPD